MYPAFLNQPLAGQIIKTKGMWPTGHTFPTARQLLGIATSSAPPPRRVSGHPIWEPLTYKEPLSILQKLKVLTVKFTGTPTWGTLISFYPLQEIRKSVIKLTLVPVFCFICLWIFDLITALLCYCLIYYSSAFTEKDLVSCKWLLHLFFCWTSPHGARWRREVVELEIWPKEKKNWLSSSWSSCSKQNRYGNKCAVADLSREPTEIQNFPFPEDYLKIDKDTCSPIIIIFSNVCHRLIGGLQWQQTILYISYWPILSLLSFLLRLLTKTAIHNGECFLLLLFFVSLACDCVWFAARALSIKH